MPILAACEAGQTHSQHVAVGSTALGALHRENRVFEMYQAVKIVVEICVLEEYFGILIVQVSNLATPLMFYFLCLAISLAIQNAHAL